MLVPANVFVLFTVVTLVVGWFCCSAYQNNDIGDFEKNLKLNRRNVMQDPFIREHIEGD